MTEATWGGAASPDLDWRMTELLNPDLVGIDIELAIEIFAEFKTDIHRIARREFVSRLGGEPPILITAADVAG